MSDDKVVRSSSQYFRQLAANAGSCRRIEGGKGFVEQKQLRLRGDGAGESDSLLLAPEIGGDGEARSPEGLRA